MVAMARRPLRNSQLVAFDNVAAGHPGVLSDQSGELIVKPCAQAEIDFYQSTSTHPEFAYYIPTFLGTISLNQEASKVATTSASTVHSHSHSLSNHLTISSTSVAPVTPPTWVPSNGAKIKTDCAIVLENVVAGLKKPNILDVKLGRRLWADDAPPAKRQKLDKVAAETTSQPLGFRIAGMKTWQGSDAVGRDGITLDGYKLYDKEYGRAFTPSTVRQGFEEYFCIKSAGVSGRPARKALVERFLEDLRGLQEVLEQEESRMYSASLLFVYEGDGSSLEADFVKSAYLSPLNVTDDEDEEESDEEIQMPKIQALKLIDFAHATWTPGQGPDENMLHGVRNVIKILTELIE